MWSVCLIFILWETNILFLTPQHRRDASTRPRCSVVASFPMITHSAAFQWLFEFKHLLCITVVSTENRIKQSF